MTSIGIERHVGSIAMLEYKLTRLVGQVPDFQQQNKRFDGGHMISSRIRIAGAFVFPSILVAVIGPSAVVWAQSAPDAANHTLDEVIVTARLRDERLLDVPAAVTVVSDAQFERLGAKSLEDFSRTVPGLTMAPSPWGTQGVPIIRGIASNAGEATVAFYIDDTPVQIPNSDFQFGSPEVKLFDITRVEVLRGPQGTLFGSGAMGGTIRFITARPSLNDLTFKTRAEIADTDEGSQTYEIGLLANGALKEDVVGLSASVLYRDQGGYIDRISRTDASLSEEDLNSQTTEAVKVGLLFAPGEHLSITPAVFYQSIDYGGLSNFRPDLSNYQSQLRDDQPVTDEFILPSLNIKYEFDTVSLLSVSSYYERENDSALDYGTFISSAFGGAPIISGLEDYIATSDVAFDQEVITQEFRLSSRGSGKAQYVLGLFYIDSETISDQTIYEPQGDELMQLLFGAPYEAVLGMPLLPGDFSFVGQGVTKRRAYAGFGELTYALTDHIKLTGGLRAEDSEISGSRVADGPLNGGLTTTTSKATDTPITGKAAFSYAPRDNIHYYMQIATGYRIGGSNRPVPLSLCADDLADIGLSEAPTSYDPDDTTNYEIGTKAEILDGRGSINAALFYIDWSSIQQAIALPTCGFVFTGNFGSAKSTGIEIEAVLIPAPGLTLSLSGSYNEAEFTSTVVSGIDPGSGEPMIVTQSGDKVPGVPEYTAAASIDYLFDVGATWQGYVRGDYQYVSDLFRTLPSGQPGFNAITYEQSSYDYASARIGLQANGWDISAFVNNLSNGRPIVGLSSEDDVTGQHLRASSFRPRTIGLTITKSF